MCRGGRVRKAVRAFVKEEASREAQAHQKESGTDPQARASSRDINSAATQSSADPTAFPPQHSPPLINTDSQPLIELARVFKESSKSTRNPTIDPVNPASHLGQAMSTPGPITRLPPELLVETLHLLRASCQSAIERQTESHRFELVSRGFQCTYLLSDAPRERAVRTPSQALALAAGLELAVDQRKAISNL